MAISTDTVQTAAIASDASKPKRKRNERTDRKRNGPKSPKPSVCLRNARNAARAAFLAIREVKVNTIRPQRSLIEYASRCEALADALRALAAVDHSVQYALPLPENAQKGDKPDTRNAREACLSIGIGNATAAEMAKEADKEYRFGQA